jgi:hypothetical protein
LKETEVIGMKDYSIEEMMLEGEAENRGYSKKAKRAFIRYNLDLLKHSGKRFDELKKKDIDKFIAEQEKKYTKRTMDTLRSAIIISIKTFRDSEFAESICRYNRRK